MDLESVILSEVSQRRSDHMIAFIRRILKKKKKKKKIQRNLQNRKRLTDLENELMVAWGKDGGKG